MGQKNKKNELNKLIDYLIIGNSAAGLSAAQTIRQYDRNGRIGVFTSEAYFNYSKPLITYYLADKIGIEKINFKDKAFYLDNNVDLFLNTEIIEIVPKFNKVISKDGKEFHYSKLLIASGGKPIIPKIEVINLSDNFNELDNLLINFKNSKLSELSYAKIKSDNEKTVILDKKMPKGVFTLTKLDDAISIKNYIKEKNIKDAVILGGGLIGLKAAEAFLNLGIKITIIELSNTILSASFDPIVSEIIKEKIQKQGSKVLTSTTVSTIFVSSGTVKKLKLTSDDNRTKQYLDCNLLVIAVGVKPNTDFINLNTYENNKYYQSNKIYNQNYNQNEKTNSNSREEKISVIKSSNISSNIRLYNGILVNERMQTNIQNIYAAGDVVKSFDKILNSFRNIAIWPLASKQGICAGSNMAGKQNIYSGGFFMNSVEILDIPVISIGLSNLSGEKELLEELEESKLVDFDKKFYNLKNISIEKFQDMEIYKIYNPEKNYYKKLVIRNNRIIGAILLGAIERAGIFSGLINNQIDISEIKKNLLKDDFGLIQLPKNYKKHLVIGEGIEV